jgi:hypothetical protein
MGRNLKILSGSGALLPRTRGSDGGAPVCGGEAGGVRAPVQRRRRQRRRRPPSQLAPLFVRPLYPSQLLPLLL